MLSIVDLHKRFGTVPALDGVGFDVPPGRIVGFLGPNGAGKTTAMRCILGLIDPDRGAVHWNGNPVTTADRQRFGYMPEERGLYPKMRIREQLVYFGRLSGMTRADASSAADRWLGRFDLADRSTSRLEELSHGNQQRIQLAVSLVHDPVLAVLDEPFSGLDPLAVETMAASLRTFAAAGVGVVFSSHQLDLVEDVCQEVVIVNDGSVVLTGTLDELRYRSGRRYLEVTVNGKEWAPEISGIELRVAPGGRRRYTVTTEQMIGDLLARAGAEGEVTSFVLQPPSLSDLFREAVRP